MHDQNETHDGDHGMELQSLPGGLSTVLRTTGTSLPSPPSDSNSDIDNSLPVNPANQPENINPSKY